MTHAESSSSIVVAIDVVISAKMVVPEKVVECRKLCRRVENGPPSLREGESEFKAGRYVKRGCKRLEKEHSCRFDVSAVRVLLLLPNF